MSEQNRQPGGVPAGGEFAGHDRPDADVKLELTDAEYNQSGTFLFPPLPRSAAQHIAFWETCPVGDDVLENVSFGYEKWASEWHAPRQYQWLTATFYPAKRINRAKADAGELSHQDQKMVDDAAKAYSRDVLSATVPVVIDPIDARTIARVGQMYYYSGGLPANERAAVEAHRIALRYETMSVYEITAKYNLTGIRHHFVGQTRAIVESLDQSRAEAAVREFSA
jgi:hypothetical protein